MAKKGKKKSREMQPSEAEKIFGGYLDTTETKTVSTTGRIRKPKTTWR